MSSHSCRFQCSLKQHFTEFNNTIQHKINLLKTITKIHKKDDKTHSSKFQGFQSFEVKSLKSSYKVILVPRKNRTSPKHFLGWPINSLHLNGYWGQPRRGVWTPKVSYVRTLCNQDWSPNCCPDWLPDPEFKVPDQENLPWEGGLTPGSPGHPKRVPAIMHNQIG